MTFRISYELPTCSPDPKQNESFHASHKLHYFHIIVGPYITPLVIKLVIQVTTHEPIFVIRKNTLPQFISQFLYHSFDVSKCEK
nr:hypothetical protein CFP56_78087 [Quercus suber]